MILPKLAQRGAEEGTLVTRKHYGGLVKEEYGLGGQRNGGPIPDLPTVQGWPCSLFPVPQHPYLFNGADKTIYPPRSGLRVQ